MSQIKVQNLTFGYEGSSSNIFENVSFQMDTDWRLGFTGRNGRGKTTFLQLLLGKHTYRGNISASVEFDYFPFEVPNPCRRTIEVLHEIYPDLVLWELQRDLSKLRLPKEILEQNFQTLSPGEKTKVMLAVLFLKPGHFLLIDEPTNHLDAGGRDTVGRYLNAQNGFILVSHDRSFLDSCVDHVLSINKTNIEIQKGNFSTWYKNKENQDNLEREQNEKLKDEVKRLSDAAARTADWSDKVEKTKIGTRNSGVKPDKGHIGHQAAKMMKRSIAIRSRREKAAEEKSKLLKNIETAQAVSIHPLFYPKPILVRAEKLSIHYGDKEICRDISFCIGREERVFLQGCNGSGKSSIAKLVQGFAIPYSGVLQLGSGLTISTIPQDASFLAGDLKQYIRENGLNETLFKTILRKLDFTREQFEQRLEDFSEGQKKKVLLAKSLSESAHLYIWDEPLNYIDVYSRMQIEELLLNYAPTMLVIEHDATFARTVATKCIEL